MSWSKLDGAVAPPENEQRMRTMLGASSIYRGGRRALAILAVGAIGWLAVSPPTAQACPFCAAVSKTLSEELKDSAVVAIARLKEAAPPPRLDGAASVDDIVAAKFEIIEVLKGAEHLKDKKVVETAYFGAGKPGALFLMLGLDPPNVIFSTPLAITERSRKYLHDLARLPPQGADRLAFFQQFLEDEEELLVRDAYDEFALASYDAVKDLAPRMNHAELVAWIQDTEIPASRRRLYLTMLGVCGSEADLPLLEEMIRSEDRKLRAGLDAMIACYLTLGGEQGLPLVEELFLKNAKTEYADTYAAIMALRFHGTETDVIPREQLVKSLRLMLERPQLADLVIPDLARWEDWGAMDRLVQLFKEADDKSSWVRVPVINYLRACPLPVAKERLQELEKIDPAAVKRANTFFPLGAPAPPKSSQSGSVEQAAEGLAATSGPTTATAYTALRPVSESTSAPADAEDSAVARPTAANQTELGSVANVSSATPLADRAGDPRPLSLWSMFATAALVVAAVQWLLLRRPVAYSGR